MQKRVLAVGNTPKILEGIIENILVVVVDKVSLRNGTVCLNPDNSCPSFPTCDNADMRATLIYPKSCSVII